MKIFIGKSKNYNFFDFLPLRECNDIGMRDNSRIMAPMTMMVMPKRIPSDNTQAYEREKMKEKKDRKFEVGKDKGKEGDEVTLQVFGEGQGPEDGIAYAKLVLMVEGGAAEGVWSYRRNGNDIPPEHNPRFIFSAHSAWCPWKKSDNSLEVQLIRPEITKTEWQDAEGNSINKAVAGDAIKLYAEVTEFEEGQGVTFTVYNERTQEAVYEAGTDVQDGKAEAQWTYHWDGEPLEEKPKYYFEVTANRCKPVKSEEAEMGAKINCHITDIFENINKDLSYSLLNEEVKIQDGKVDSDGNIKVDDLIPGNIYLLLSSENELETLSGKYSDKKNVIKISESELDKYKIKIDLTLENLIIIDPDTAPVSF